MDLRIAYEDEHLIVVDKPAGLVVHPASGHATGTLVHGLLEHDIAGGDAGASRHRAPSRPRHLRAHGRREIGGGIRAVCRNWSAAAHSNGTTPPWSLDDRGREAAAIEAPIGRDRRDPLRQSLDTDKPREAITNFD